MEHQNQLGAGAVPGADGGIYDVAIIGYGPAGEVLASTLGSAGFKVLVIERWPQPYPLPRLTTLDGEVIRVVQATGLDADKAFAECSVQSACEFVDADGAPLMTVEYPGQLGGWPERMSVFQPDFEHAIAAKVETMANVQVFRGWEATEMMQDVDGVTIGVSRFDVEQFGCVGPVHTVRARYVVGTDGARSFVRRSSGIGMRDFDMHERWLNFDAEILRPLPETMQHLKIFMDPKRPHMHMPIGTRRLRLEFRVMDDETDEQVTDPAVAWEFLSRQHGIGPDDVRIMRQVVYHYHTRIAERWNVGRVFLAGDAAHTMPPYMGQGGCAAIRDGRNLGWKLVEVLSGRSTPALLDEYAAEREPHVSTLVMASDRLSRIVNIVDPVRAAERNEGMRKQGAVRPPDLPKLGAGVLHREADGTVGPLAGLFTPQGRVLLDGRLVRGDDVLGSGFQLWCRIDPTPFLGTRERSILATLGCAIAVFDPFAVPYGVNEPDGTYRAFLEKHRADFVLVRPDFYTFGGGAFGAINQMVSELAERLHSVSGEPILASAAA